MTNKYALYALQIIFFPVTIAVGWYLWRKAQPIMFSFITFQEAESWAESLPAFVRFWAGMGDKETRRARLASLFR